MQSRKTHGPRGMSVFSPTVKQLNLEGGKCKTGVHTYKALRKVPGWAASSCENILLATTERTLPIVFLYAIARREDGEDTVKLCEPGHKLTNGPTTSSGLRWSMDHSLVKVQARNMGSPPHVRNSAASSWSSSFSQHVGQTKELGRFQERPFFSGRAEGRRAVSNAKSEWWQECHDLLPGGRVRADRQRVETYVGKDTRANAMQRRKREVASEASQPIDHSWGNIFKPNASNGQTRMTWSSTYFPENFHCARL